MISLILAIISLALTVMLYLDAKTWWPYALLSYGVIAAFIYYANKRVGFELFDAAK